MVEDLVNVLNMLKSDNSALRRGLFFDVDNALQQHKETLERIKPGMYKIPSEIDEYK